MPLPEPPLPAGFFARDALTVARDLLGCRLRVACAHGGPPIVCRIVETEAYTQEDPACHAFNRQTGRAATLFKAPGLAYVYLIYGMYHCLNVVTDPPGRAGAVLFRALEPPADANGALKTNGPGRLTRALAITRERHNEIDMTDPASALTLHPREPGVTASPPMVQTTRIGISQGAELPWRFYVEDSPWVSVKAKPPSPRP